MKMIKLVYNNNKQFIFINPDSIQSISQHIPLGKGGNDYEYKFTLQDGTSYEGVNLFGEVNIETGNAEGLNKKDDL